MWIIVANRNLDQFRDDRISELFGNSTDKEYLSKRGTGDKRYYINRSTAYAVVFKTEAGALRLIEEFKNGDKLSYSSKFYWIKDLILSVRKLTLEEWHQIVDLEISKAQSRYNKQIDNLIKKKNQYK